MTPVRAQIEAEGFAIIHEPLLLPGQIGELEQLLTPPHTSDGGQRNLLDRPDIIALANSRALLRLVEPVLGPYAFPVRAILFDKTPQANWKVAWHQDLTIAVRKRLPLPGFGPWSTKAGVIHVQPPVGYLEEMLSVRLHLDDCGPANGPLRVLPGSHRAGKIPEHQIPVWRTRLPEQICLVPRGCTMLMRPLLLHASSPATVATHRRVLHVEYASQPLLDGLEWRWPAPRAVGAA